MKALTLIATLVIGLIASTKAAQSTNTYSGQGSFHKPFMAAFTVYAATDLCVSADFTLKATDVYSLRLENVTTGVGCTKVLDPRFTPGATGHMEFCWNTGCPLAALQPGDYVVYWWHANGGPKPVTVTVVGELSP